MKEFKINEFLTLKLEDGKTNIYVKGEHFDQCKFLMLNIPIDETHKFEEIESIDEAADILGWTEEEQEGVEYEIDHDTEFWGHCSNLQVWYENDYDTRLLHSNLAFPLLKKLTAAGDPLAKIVFKEEITKRFESGYPTVIKYILRTNLLDFLNNEEREHLLKPYFSNILSSIEKQSIVKRLDSIDDMINLSKGTYLLERNLSEILKIIDDVFPKYTAYGFFTLIKVGKITGGINENFIAFLYLIKDLSDYEKQESYFTLLKIAKNIGGIEKPFLDILRSIFDEYLGEVFRMLPRLVDLTRGIEEHFFAILDIFNHFCDENLDYDEDFNYNEATLRFRVFSVFIKSIEKSALLNKKTSQNKPYYLALLDSIKKFVDNEKYDAFCELLELIKNDKENIKKLYPDFLKIIVLMPEHPPWEKEEALLKLFKVAKDLGQIEENFHYFLKTLDDLQEKSRAFSILLETALEKKLIEKFFLVFLKLVEAIDGRKKSEAINKLIKVVKESGELEKYFFAILNAIEKIPDLFYWEFKYRTISELFSSINAELKNEYSSQIKIKFNSYLETLEKIPHNYLRDELFALIKISIEFGWIKEVFPTFLRFRLSDKYPYDFNSWILTRLLNIAKKEGLIKKHFSVFMEHADTYVFPVLVTTARDLGWLDENFSSFLEVLNRLESIYRLSAFTSLLDSIKESNLMGKYEFQIKAYFLSYLKNIDKMGHLKNIDKKGGEIFKLLTIANEMEWIEELFEIFLEIIHQNGSKYKSAALLRLIKATKNSEILIRNIYQVEKIIQSLFDEIKKSDKPKKVSIFSNLLKITKELDFLDKFFLVFLEKFEIFSGYTVFCELFDTIKTTDLLTKYYNEIEAQFLVVLNEIDNFYGYKDLFLLTKSIYNTELFLKTKNSQIERKFLDILKNSTKDTIKHHLLEFLNFIEVAKLLGIIEVQFPVLINFIGQLGNPNDYGLFRNLLNIAIEFDIVKNHFPSFLKEVAKIHTQHQVDAFSKLLSVKDIDELINENFPIILNSIADFRIYIAEYQQFRALSILIYTTKNIDLLDKYYPEIEIQCFSLLDCIVENWSKSWTSITTQRYFLKDDIPSFLSFFSTLFEKLPNYRKKEAYLNLVNHIKDTKLYYEIPFKKWMENNVIS